MSLIDISYVGNQFSILYFGYYLDNFVVTSVRYSDLADTVTPIASHCLIIVFIKVTIASVNEPESK